MQRFVVISADCHAVGRPDDFTQYLESKYVDAYASGQNFVNLTLVQDLGK